MAFFLPLTNLRTDETELFNNNNLAVAYQGVGGDDVLNWAWDYGEDPGEPMGSMFAFEIVDDTPVVVRKKIHLAAAGEGGGSKYLYKAAA